MPQTSALSPAILRRDLIAGLIVFLVALPLCLGVGLASGAPLLSGVIAGVIGGILVGLVSGSHTSITGPATGLSAVVAAQIATLGSFETFLLAVVLAGLIQILLGIVRAGFIAAFIPSSVIKGMLAAIGVLLILKQIPHVVGHDPDPVWDLAFEQPDQENTFTELARMVGDIHPGAAAIGLLSVALLVLWARSSRLKKLPVPAPLGVVLLGVALALLFRSLGPPWQIEPSHLVQVPVAQNLAEFLGFLQLPNFGQWRTPAVYTAALTLAAVASLQTLLSLEAVDKLDPEQRTSPPNRELIAQGVGNVVSGLVGGLPVALVIVRSSVSINAGGRTKLAAVFHGVLLLVSVALLPAWLNFIPLSCLGAILLVTGINLASPALFRRMWEEGRHQFVPFIATVMAIVLTDLLIGVLIGLVVSASFILWSNAKRPIRRIVEKHLGGDVVHVELPNQVSFLNRAALARALHEVPPGGHVLLDARGTDYIDPDILHLIQDFQETTGPARGVEVSHTGFRSEYHLEDRIQYIDYSTRDLQEAVTPAQVLQILKDGNERFRSGRHLTRDLGRQVEATAAGQHPLAVVLSCIDSRTPPELIFDLGVGDIFSVRLAGNVTSRKVLGSIEYACAMAGAKLVVVMGHTRCGAVKATVNVIGAGHSAADATGCDYLDYIVQDLRRSVDEAACLAAAHLSASEKEIFINDVARRNVDRAVKELRQQSRVLARLVGEGRVAIAGAMYDVATGAIEFLLEEGNCSPSP
jgi:carbonic anhydrase